VDNKILREWNERLCKEGLSMKRGEERRKVFYAGRDPEGFPVKQRYRPVRCNRRVGRTEKQCPECGEWFVAKRNAVRCSNRCRNRALRNKRLREKICPRLV
jgi:hypothetical protein